MINSNDGSGFIPNLQSAKGQFKMNSAQCGINLVADLHYGEWVF